MTPREKSQGEESRGDYGYDLAHQDLVPPSAPRGSDRALQRAQHAAGGAGDVGGDYGYDEAHDF